MSDYVWVSNFMNDANLIAMTTTDITEEDTEGAITGIKALKSGHPVDKANLPSSIYLDEEAGPHLPPLFDANGFYVVNGRVADILSRHDLGEGALHSVNILRSDKSTAVEGGWYCWVFGNRKSAFSKKESDNLREFGPSGGEWAKLPFVPSDFDIAVSREALKGPDVWIDPPLFKSIFLGKELGDALTAAGLGEALRIYRARVV